ncbi:MAG: substrate-binding domain-containing protein [bacterium]
MMKKSISLLVTIGMLLGLTSFGYAKMQRLRIASTTSTDNSGLFTVLNPPFEKQFNCSVDVIAQGTGKALKTGEMGDCDVVFVHSRPAEDTFIQQGFGVNRRDVMYNDFIVLGPPEDPAGIKGLKDAGEALKKIAAAHAKFVSRGDDSGTHKKEKSLWAKTGLTPNGKWYIESGQGMGAVLNLAHEMKAYTLSDRGTYLAYQNKIDCVVVTEGDPDLFNPYGIIAVNPARHQEVNYLLAMAYIGWVTSPEGQKIIKEFGKEKYGMPLFTPVAVP